MSDIVKKEAATSIYNIALSFVPGNFILKELQDLRGRIYQSRLNYFVEVLKESFENVTGKKYDPENLKSADFLDSFEILVRKAVYTKSKEKIKRYKNVLLREMFEPGKTESDFFLKYVNLIEELNEVQIIILDKLEIRGSGHLLKVKSLIEKKNNGELKNIAISNNVEVINGEMISLEDLNFLLQEMAGKGLLHRVTSNKKNVFTQTETYEVNTVGKRFLKFIKEYEAEEK